MTIIETLKDAVAILSDTTVEEYTKMSDVDPISGEAPKPVIAKRFAASITEDHEIARNGAVGMMKAGKWASECEAIDRMLWAAKDAAYKRYIAQGAAKNLATRLALRDQYQAIYEAISK